MCADKCTDLQSPTDDKQWEGKLWEMLYNHCCILLRRTVLNKVCRTKIYNWFQEFVEDILGIYLASKQAIISYRNGIPV